MQDPVENKNYTITVTDVVNLIIEKKSKEIDDIIEEKKNLINDLQEKFKISVQENSKKLKAFLEENFEEKSLQKFILSSLGEYSFTLGFGGWGGRHGRTTPSNEKVEIPDSCYEELYKRGLVFKGNISEVDEIQILNNEISDLHYKKHDIEHSREKLIAEVTLEKLSSVDADFKENIEKLTERIFNSNTKLIN